MNQFNKGEKLKNENDFNAHVYCEEYLYFGIWKLLWKQTKKEEYANFYGTKEINNLKAK